MRKAGLLACSAILLACLAAGALVFLFPARLLQAAGDLLIVQDDLRPADLIQVAAGPGGGREHRANYAIQLYQDSLGEKIFFTGGRCQAQASLEEQRCASLAERAGIPRGDILVDEVEVESTYAEAMRLKSFIDGSPEPVRSVIVVSDPHHTRRAMWTYRRVLGEGVTIQVAPVPFESSPYRRIWWRDPVSRSFVLSEYLKFAYYFLNY